MSPIDPEWLNSFHLLRPWGLLLLLPVVALLWGLRAHTRGDSRWQDVIDPILAPFLLIDGPASRVRWPLWAAGLGWTIAVIGFCGPSWERIEQPPQQRNDGMVILLDLSLSMYARDIAPSRIDRARFEIQDLLDARSDGLTGLIAYAGDAHAVTPLTDDVETVANLLPALEPSIMPLAGSELAPALELAKQLLTASALEHGQIILVTDEINNLADVSEHADRRFPLSILAIGTDAGGPIPLDFANQPGALLKDDQGLTVLPRLDRRRLAEAARIGGGTMVVARPDDRDTAALIDRPASAFSVADGEGALSIVFDVWEDAGYWLVLLLLPLVFLCFRPGVLIVTLAFSVTLAATLPGSAQAESAAPPLAAASDPVGDAPPLGLQWADLWQRRDQQGAAALQRGEPGRAAALFEDPAWRGTAMYRSQRYAEAQRWFGQGNDVRALYNRGTAQARQGKFKEALASYEQALQIDPEHADTLHNKAILERLENQRQSDEAQNPQNQQRGGGDEEQEESQNEGSNQSEQSDDPQSSQQQSDGEGADGQGQQSEEEPAEDGAEQDKQSAQEQADQEEAEGGAAQASPEGEDGASQEQDAAMAQWLRRIPDDPGGLLKNKFEYESRQRYMERAQRRREGSRIW